MKKNILKHMVEIVRALKEELQGVDDARGIGTDG